MFWQKIPLALDKVNLFFWSYLEFMLTGVEVVAEFPNLPQAPNTGGTARMFGSENQYQAFVLVLKYSHMIKDHTC